MAGEDVAAASISKPQGNPTRFDNTVAASPGRNTQNTVHRFASTSVLSTLQTNYLKYTETLTNGVWVKDAEVTVSTSTEVAPLASKYGTKLVTSISGKKIEQETVDTFNQTVWFNIWMKTDNTANVRMKVSNVGGDVFYKDYSITKYWQHFIVSGTPTFNQVVKAELILNTLENVYVYGPQIIKGTENFSVYLPSTGTLGTYEILSEVKRCICSEASGFYDRTILKEDGTGTKLIESI